MAEEPEYKLDPSLTDRDLWFRIARELTTIRRQNTELLGFYRDAESEVPESLRRFANYFHDLHDIKFVYEEHGSTPPDYVLQELERLHDRYRQILRKHKTDGGAIDLILREMAADQDNRYKHTPQLSKRKDPTNDPARPSDALGNGVDKARTDPA